MTSTQSQFLTYLHDAKITCPYEALRVGIHVFGLTKQEACHVCAKRA